MKRLRDFIDYFGNACDPSFQDYLKIRRKYFFLLYAHWANTYYMMELLGCWMKKKTIFLELSPNMGKFAKAYEHTEQFDE